MQKNRQKLLVAKIQIPDIQKDYLRRDMLLDELEGMQEKLLICHATIGYGKTVLMAEFVQKCERFCAWYHLDILDNEISTFVQYLVLSMQQALGDFMFDVEHYLMEEEVQVPQMTRDLVMELTEYFAGMPEKKLFLVLDDFQVLENPEIFGLLEDLLNHTNEQFRMLIATKSAIPDAFSKYIMRGQGRIIDFQRLSFREQEVADVLKHLLSEEEAEQYAEMVWKNMEGWPAGVMFAALYLRQMTNLGQRVEWEHISQQSMVHNYITYELFKTLPYEIQNFLLCTSFAAELQPELCNDICGITNASGILKYLLQENMFILHMGEKKGSYRYHSIFRNFLNEQAGEELQKKMCGRLAHYYMKRQEYTVAAQYAQEAGENEYLLLVIEKAGISMFYEGKRKLVEEYLHIIETCQEKWSPTVWFVSAVCAFWNEEWEVVLQSLEMACEGDDTYHAYRMLYEGLIQRREGKQKEAEKLVDDACSLFSQKNRELPPLPEEAKQFVKGFLKRKQNNEKLISVSCFGKFGVTILPVGKEISWRTRKAMELFAYLVDLEGKPVERRVLLEQLWEDELPNNAVAMLHNMIYSIRKELSVCPGLENLIQYRNRQYSMNMSLVSSELDEIKQLCTLAEQGKTEELLERKESFQKFWGVYLEEVDGAWCTARRAYFERNYGKVCRILATDCEKREEFEDAVTLWRAYMEADRYSEDAIAGLLRAYGCLGERSQMKKVYEAARKMFQEELGLELSPETVHIYEEGLGKKR